MKHPMSARLRDRPCDSGDLADAADELDRLHEENKRLAANLAWWSRCAYGHAKGRKVARRRAKRAKQDFVKLHTDDTVLIKLQRAEIGRLRAALKGDGSRPGFYAAYREGFGWWICGPGEDGAVAFFGGKDG